MMLSTRIDELADGLGPPEAFLAEFVVLFHKDILYIF